MDTIIVGQTTYTKRRYTPKRKGQPAGHGWVRAVEGASAATGQAECSAAMVALLDYIERLEVANGSDLPTVIGHDRAVIDRVVKLAHVALRTKFPTTDPVDTRRGSTFYAQAHPDPDARFRITVELEPPS